MVAHLLAEGAKVDVEDEEGWTPLHSAASRGDAAVLAQLLAAGADVDAATSSGAQALHFAASKGPFWSWLAVEWRPLRAVRVAWQDMKRCSNSCWPQVRR